MASKSKKRKVEIRLTDHGMIAELIEKKSDETNPFLRTLYEVEALTIKLDSMKYKSPSLLLNKDKQISFYLIFLGHDNNNLDVQLEFNQMIEFKEILILVNFKKNEKPLPFIMIRDSDNPRLYKSKEAHDVSPGEECRLCESSFSHECKSERSEAPVRYKVHDFLILYKFKDDNNVFWQKAFETILFKKEYSDLTIIANNKVEFKAHKAIVSAKSKMLKSLIDADMNGKRENKIYLNKIEPETMNEVLHFIYLNNCDLSKGVGVIYEAAHQYKIPGLVSYCKRYLSSNLDMSNVIEAMNLVDLYELEDLKPIVQRFTKVNELELAKNSEFVKHLLNVMNSENIHYIYRVTMAYKLKIVDKVKQFIKANRKEVLANEKFKKLLQKHPEWPIDN